MRLTTIAAAAAAAGAACRKVPGIKRRAETMTNARVDPARSAT